MQSNYRPALELAQRNLRSLDAESVARRSGADLFTGSDGHELRLKLLDRQYSVPLPESRVYDVGTGAEAGVSPTLVVLHYLLTADGSQSRGEWLPFRGLPGGNIYEQAFRRQCLEPLVATFGCAPQALAEAAEGLSAVKVALGDLSYLFQALPHLPMACVLWFGDEEQGAEANLLFDAVAPRCLPTEDLAALGRLLAFALIRQAGRVS